MKCVKKGTNFKRVTDDLANALVKHEGYSYCSKQQYRDRPAKTRGKKK